ncbi:MAG: hypothetical protein MJ074_07705 [Oscillospiraceae bacterium]|nr:hypothetical protein [Oscillospiraceae bacterium]
MNVDEIIRALRCTNSYPQPEHDCDSCPYQKVERLPFEYHQMADFWRDYEPYVYACPCEQIALDAAEALEMLGRRKR